jgi:uroporphyrinogen decarboxylase
MISYYDHNFREWKKPTKRLLYGREKKEIVAMTPRERIQAALRHEPTDCVPRGEIWIDALWHELGYGSQVEAYVNSGQDWIMLPACVPKSSNAWKTGIDEWGRVWQDGDYVAGVIDSEDDLQRYSPDLAYVELLFSPEEINQVRQRYPDHCLMYGTHIGPFTAAYMGMGFERFFLRIADDPEFVHHLLDLRTEWCIALYQHAIRLGAEVLVLGEDAAHKDCPMISPRLWQELVLPYHRRIVKALNAPLIWHCDGNITPLLPAAVEAGFVGVHALEPPAGIDLKQVKQQYGQDLALVGNIDVGVLLEDDLEAIHREVDRCLNEGAPGSGYILATSSSIFHGMHPESVAEMFRYQQERCVQ